MRTFERTHPWIRFAADLRNAPTRLWLLLGECHSKCEHIAGVPLRPSIADLLHRVYLAKGVHATTAIEGNTLSEEQVLEQVDGQLSLPLSQQYMKQEVANIIAACNKITEHIKAGQPLTLDTKRVKQLNKLVLRDLTLDKDVVAGEIRKTQVGVQRYRGAPPEDCAFLLDRLCEWLNGDEFRAPPQMEIVYAIVKAVVAHLYLAWIHPFGDGNGRTARLVEFQILLDSGVPTPAAHLLSNHYNQTRTEYYRQLEEASRSGGDVVPFMSYAVEGFRDGLRSQLERIRAQQWTIAWENYVHDAFRDKANPSDVRRQQLVLDLSEQLEPVEASKLATVSPRVAAAYAKKTRKTLSRDLNALLHMGLIEKDQQGRFRAKREQILAFLPSRARSS